MARKKKSIDPLYCADMLTIDFLKDCIVDQVQTIIKEKCVAKIKKSVPSLKHNLTVQVKFFSHLPSMILGRAVYDEDKKVCRLEFSIKALTPYLYCPALFEHVVKHEYAHYIMHKLGMHKHNHGDSMFKMICRYLGISNASSVSYTDSDEWRSLDTAVKSMIKQLN